MCYKTERKQIPIKTYNSTYWKQHFFHNGYSNNSAMNWLQELGPIQSHIKESMRILYGLECLATTAYSFPWKGFDFKAAKLTDKNHTGNMQHPGYLLAHTGS
jgi:hypothetical protein